MDNHIWYINKILKIGTQKNCSETHLQTNNSGNGLDREGPLRNFIVGQVF